MSDKILSAQTYRQSRPPVYHSHHADRKRRWVVIARIGMLTFTLLALGLFLSGLPAYYVQLRTPCTTSSSSCLDKQLTVGLAQAAQNAGLSLNAYATFIIIITLLSALVCVLIAVLLLWHTSNSWMVLLVAVLLVFTGTENLAPERFLPGTFTLVTILAFLYWLLGFTSGAFVFLLFPNGRFVPRRTRWVMITHAILAILIGVVSISFRSQILDLMSDIIWVPFLIIALAVQIYRYWRVSTSVERQQTKLVFFVFTWCLLYLLVIGSLHVLFSWFWHSDSLFTLITNIIASLLFSLLFPLALGMAVLRYRLYDIDVVINRTLVYSTLTLSIFGIYVLVVEALGVLLQAQGNALISLLATGLVAILFQPLRVRLQRLVNRLMYGDRHTPYQAISRLGQRLEATLASDAVLPTIVETMAQALKLPYVAMSLKQEGALAIAASFGVAQEPLVQLPLLYQGESVGELLLAPRAAGETFSSADRRLLEDLARHAGIAVHTVGLANNLKQLTKELQRSRTALVTAREEERRRLRRDLHDGMGSTLASLNWQAGALRQALRRNPVAAHALIIEQQEIIRSALADIRRLVDDLRPPSLDELGLVGALRERAAQVTIPTGALLTQEQVAKLHVRVEAAEALPPLPAAIEVAAYRIVQEALTNVVRHAHATTCQVRLSVVEGSLHVEVSDDGVGIAPRHQAGVGLLSMQERAAEVGGTCSIHPGARGGTEVCARLPFPTD